MMKSCVAEAGDLKEFEGIIPESANLGKHCKYHRYFFPEEANCAFGQMHRNAPAIIQAITAEIAAKYKIVR